MGKDEMTQMSSQVGELRGRLETHMDSVSKDVTEMKGDIKLLLAALHEQQGILRAASATWGFVGGLVGAVGAIFGMKHS